MLRTSACKKASCVKNNIFVNTEHITPQQKKIINEPDKYKFHSQLMFDS